MRIGAFEVNESIGSLRDPIVVATLRPWIDAGSVGTLALRHLQDVLGTRDAGELVRPGEFFDFTRYRPTVRYSDDEREFVVPNTRLSYARRHDSPDILFLDVLEPHARAEEYIDSIVAVLATAGAKAHWRLGAWFGGVPHTRPLRVTMSLGSRQVDPKTRRETGRATRYEGPTSIMSLLGPRLEAEGIENNALMAQIPHYGQLDEDHSATAAMLQAVGEALGLMAEVEAAVVGMRSRGEREYEQLNRMVSASSDLRAAVEQLEQMYDAERRASERKGPSLSAEIERFLGEVVRGIDDGADKES